MNNGFEQFKENTLIEMNEFEKTKGIAILCEAITRGGYRLWINDSGKEIKLNSDDKNYETIKNFYQKGIAELVEDGFLLERDKHQYILTSKGKNNK